MNEFLKHLRSIHFAIVVASIGVLATQFFNKQGEAFLAYKQFNQIMIDLRRWDADIISNAAGNLIAAGKFGKKALNGHYLIEFTLQESEITIKKKEKIQPIFYSKDPRDLIESTYGESKKSQRKEEKTGPVFNLKDQSEKLKNIMEKPTTLDKLNSIVSVMSDGIWGVFPTGINDRGLVKRRGKFALFSITDENSGPYQIASVSCDKIDAPEKNFKQNIFKSIYLVNENSQKKYRKFFVDEQFNAHYEIHDQFIFHGNDVYESLVPIGVSIINMEALKLLEDQLGTSWQYLPLSDSFPELMNVTKEFKDESFETVKKFLESEKRRSSNVFEAFGIKIPGSDIAIWGLAAMLVLQIYFLVHYQQFRKLYPKDKGTVSVEFPWIGTYDSLIARCLLVLSVAILPFSTHTIIVFRGIYTRGLGVPESISFGFGLGGLVVAYLTFSSLILEFKDSNKMPDN
jgi:hypothetical protein